MPSLIVGMSGLAVGVDPSPFFEILRIGCPVVVDLLGHNMTGRPSRVPYVSVVLDVYYTPINRHSTAIRPRRPTRNGPAQADWFPATEPPPQGLGFCDGTARELDR